MVVDIISENLPIVTFLIISIMLIYLLRYITIKIREDTFNRTSELTELSPREFYRAYKLHCHADDHYATRINFFLVAESMLVISFVTSLTNWQIL